jgi:hypothetical protein
MEMMRQIVLNGLLLSGLLAGSVLPVARADDPKPGGQKSATEQPNIESKVEKAVPMPDFAGAYGLPFESLQSLGYRLTDARHKGDPVALGMIGIELAVAEKVSARTADVTSDAILKEATDLAKMRGRDKELAALALIVHDASIAKELTDLRKDVEKAEAERIAKFKSGERERGVRILEVVNNTHHRLSVRVNGEHVGWVPPFTVENIQLHPRYHEPHQLWLNAHDHFGNHVRAHASTGQHHRFTWIINEGE